MNKRNKIETDMDLLNRVALEFDISEDLPNEGDVVIEKESGARFVVKAQVENDILLEQVSETGPEIGYVAVDENEFDELFEREAAGKETKDLPLPDRSFLKIIKKRGGTATFDEIFDDLGFDMEDESQVREMLDVLVEEGYLQKRNQRYILKKSQMRDYGDSDHDNNLGDNLDVSKMSKDKCVMCGEDLLSDEEQASHLCDECFSDDERVPGATTAQLDKDVKDFITEPKKQNVKDELLDEFTDTGSEKDQGPTARAEFADKKSADIEGREMRPPLKSDKKGSRHSRLAGTDEQEDKVAEVEKALHKAKFEITESRRIGQHPQTVILYVNRAYKDPKRVGRDLEEVVRIDADGQVTTDGRINEVQAVLGDLVNEPEYELADRLDDESDEAGQDIPSTAEKYKEREKNKKKSFIGKTKTGKKVIMLSKQGGDMKVLLEGYSKPMNMTKQSLLKFGITWGPGFSEENRTKWEHLWKDGYKESFNICFKNVIAQSKDKNVQLAKDFCSSLNQFSFES